MHKCEFFPYSECEHPAVAIFVHNNGREEWYCQTHYDIMMGACESLGRGEGKPEWWKMWKLNA